MIKKLNELYDCEYDTEIKDIKINSKEVKPGDIFVCTKGVTADRHDFIDDAIKNGASALVVGKDVKVKVPTIKVDNPNEELPNLVARFYNHPEKSLKLVGITGTDGKTTTATIIQHLMGNDKCGYIGTNGVRSLKYNEETPNTTPDTPLLYKFLYNFKKTGCEYVVMEASSEAFYRERLKTFTFDYSVYTNITSDHLNIHKTLKNYIECKCRLFEQTKKDGICVLNKDDKYYETVLKHCNGKVYTYGKNKNSDLQIIDFKLYSDKTIIKVKYNNNNKIEFTSPLLGEFNVYNLCAGLLVCLKMGYTIYELLKKISSLQIEGRLNVVDLGQNYNIIIDYAHTTNALKNLLTFANQIKKNRIITVTGSAGGREKEKRPKMGEVVCNLSDMVIFTADDPRYEEVIDIIHDMISTTDKKNYIIEVDRAKAIKKALEIAQKDDIIVIAGRGNDSEMPYKGGFIHCNDFEEVKKYIEKEGIK